MKTSYLIYISHFLSSWGDSMWKFAIAVFLMNLEKDKFLLIGIYGLTLATCVLIFGPIIGDWIDKTKRLFAVKVSLFVQNLAVAVCALIFLAFNLSLITPSKHYTNLVKAFSIIMGAIAQLASVATQIIIEKDWIVVIASEGSGVLANLNAVTRRINLVTKILAPIACAQVIALTSISFGCGFIAGWNLISMCFEYLILKRVYDKTPALALDKNKVVINEDIQEINDNEVNGNEQNYPQDDMEMEDVYVSSSTEALTQTFDEEDVSFTGSRKSTVKKIPLYKKMFSVVLTLYTGWKTFKSQSVWLAGLGLSFLHMTVLGFDSVTTSYAYNQCYSELMLSLMLGAAAITGVVATFIFPWLRNKIGLTKTGLFSSVAQLISLIPCLMSLFVVGSPFYLTKPDPNEIIMNTTLPLSYRYSTTPQISAPSTQHSTVLINQTFIIYNENQNSSNSLFYKCLEGNEPPESYFSLTLFMVGIIAARVGLWMFDLTVTQLFQESVQERDRGIVGGVQSSLNNLMDLLHFVLIIALPHPYQFGILVIVSCIFVFSGHLLYALFAFKKCM